MYNVKKTDKSCGKARRNFTTWLRQKKLKTCKDFKDKCEWTYKYDEITKYLCVKRWDDQHYVHKKV